mmetsp:Transcript_24864/g.98733  ORF Transcript_24864/g.98733 Transcript_24864/m.98733 type:complete len:326 (+) Transcript_24864:1921-2898(+)
MMRRQRLTARRDQLRRRAAAQNVVETLRPVKRRRRRRRARVAVRERGVEEHEVRFDDRLLGRPREHAVLDDGQSARGRPPPRDGVAAASFGRVFRRRLLGARLEGARDAQQRLAPPLLGLRLGVDRRRGALRRRERAVERVVSRGGLARPVAAAVPRVVGVRKSRGVHALAQLGDEHRVAHAALHGHDDQRLHVARLRVRGLELGAPHEGVERPRLPSVRSELGPRARVGRDVRAVGSDHRRFVPLEQLVPRSRGERRARVVEEAIGERDDALERLEQPLDEQLQRRRVVDFVAARRRPRRELRRPRAQRRAEPGMDGHHHHHHP